MKIALDPLRAHLESFWNRIYTFDCPKVSKWWLVDPCYELLPSKGLGLGMENNYRVFTKHLIFPKSSLYCLGLKSSLQFAKVSVKWLA